MPEKSLYQQISNSKETYTDGYGQTREVYEPKYVGVLRKAYNAANKFLNGPSEEEYHNMGVERPLQGLGFLEFLTLPEAAVLKSINITSTKNLPKTYEVAVSEYNKLMDLLKKNGKFVSKQHKSRLNFLTDALGGVDQAANDAAVIRTKRLWSDFDKELEIAKKSPNPEMIWDEYIESLVPAYNYMERPEKVLANPKEMWEFMYKNIESKEQAKARAKTVKQSIQNARDAKDAKAYAKWAADPEATLNYSAGFFKDGFHYKQGGILKRK